MNLRVHRPVCLGVLSPSANQSLPSDSGDYLTEATLGPRVVCYYNGARRVEEPCNLHLIQKTKQETSILYVYETYYKPKTPRRMHTQRIVLLESLKIDNNYNRPIMECFLRLQLPSILHDTTASRWRRRGRKVFCWFSWRGCCHGLFGNGLFASLWLVLFILVTGTAPMTAINLLLVGFGCIIIKEKPLFYLHRLFIGRKCIG